MDISAKIIALQKDKKLSKNQATAIAYAQQNSIKQDDKMFAQEATQMAPNNSNTNQNQNSFNVPIPTYYDLNPPYFSTSRENPYTTAPYTQGDYNMDNVVNQSDKNDKFGNPSYQGSYNDAVNIEDQPKIDAEERRKRFTRGATYDIGTKVDYAGYNFGKGNNLMGTLGLVSAGLEGIRTGMSSYASAKESTRLAQENQDKLFRDERKYRVAQQGGKVTNSMMLTDQYIADEGEGNINMEDSEFVKRAESGDVQKVVGEKHIENGKKAPGVNATLNEGDKVLSDYTKIPLQNIKELKERHGLALKKGATFADAQKMFDRKIGITKLTDDLATTIEKLDNNETIKDATTKRLNELVLAKQIKEKKEVIDMLKDPQSMIFEELFSMQEGVPKLGDGSVLFDKKGKPIEEEQEYIAKLKGEGYSSTQAYLLYKNRFKKNYSQQGELIQYTPKKGQLRLNDAQAMELNRGSGIDFTSEFAKSGYFVTDEQFEKERRERMMAQSQAESQRKYKITDITAETESPTANRRIWHDKKPEYYTGRQEVMEGREYTTIPYSQWNDFKNSPEYMKYKGIPSPSMVSMQGGGYAQLGRLQGLEGNPAFMNSLNQFDPNRPTQAGLFSMQEGVPKLGDGSVLFDKKGKPIEEEEEIAQQGTKYLALANKYGISPERADELVAQQGGMIKRADGSYSKRGLWDNLRKNRGSGKKPTKQMLEQERKINKNRQEGGQEMNSEQGQQMPMEQEPQDQMQQVFQAIAQMMQQQMPPQEITQNLVKMGVPQEQVGALISQVAEQLNQQAPQQQDEEQIATQEMAQEGGGIPESYRNKGFTKVGVKKDSNVPGKKWSVLAKKGDKYKIVHGGATGMKDFSQHGSEERKKRFWDRMGGRDSAKANDPFSPLYWHKRGFSNSKATWQQGGEYQDASETSGMIEEALNQGDSFKEVYKKLISKGLSEEMAIDLLSEYEQDENEQEQHVAQEGKFIYNLTTGQNEYRTNERTPLQHAKKGEAYGNIEAQKSIQFLYNNFPDIAQKQFKDNISVDKTGNVTFKKNIDLSVPQEAVRLAQVAKNSRMNTSADVILNNSSMFSPDHVKEAQRYKTEETYLDNADSKKGTADGIRGYDSKNGKFDSGRYSLGLDLVTPDDNQKLMGSGIRTLRQLRESPLLKDLSKDSQERVTEMISLVGDKDADFSINEFTPKTPIVDTKEQKPAQEYTGEKIQDPLQVDQVQEEFSGFGLPQRMWMPPPAMSAIKKEQISLQRQEPIKATTEPYLAEQERQRQTDVERVMQSGLTPQQQEAMLASGLSTSQMASNDAISKVEQYNAQNQSATDQFNIGQRSKEDITNTQYNQAFMDKAEASKMYNNRDWSNYYNDRYKNDFNNWDTERKVNLGNQMFENYKQNQNGVAYEGSQQQKKDFNTPILNEAISKLTPQQTMAYIKYYHTGMSREQAYNTVIKAT